jgi:hypothetical protein
MLHVFIYKRIFLNVISCKTLVILTSPLVYMVQFSTYASFAPCHVKYTQSLIYLSLIIICTLRGSWARWQAAQHLSLFQFAVSWCPCIAFKHTSVNITILIVIFNDSDGKFYLNMLHDILGFYTQYLMKELEMSSFILLVKWLSLKLSSLKGLYMLSSLFFSRSKVKNFKSSDPAKNVEATHACLLFCHQTFPKNARHCLLYEQLHFLDEK